MAARVDTTATFTDLMASLRARAERALHDYLPEGRLQPNELHEAMRYAVLNGGKRIRAILVYASGGAVGAPDDTLDAPACAVEFIHAYSLVHDDLPCMDDDDLRRGKPSCHKAFDEATALLAGDALQTLAFHVLANFAGSQIDMAQRLRMVDALAMASGSRGMAGGQAIDLAAVGKDLTLPELENMHIHKTGALIRASVRLGAICRADVSTEQVERLDHYAKCIGLAFQIRDDVLDVEGDTETLGKQRGSDTAKNKPTYPALVGPQAAKQMAAELHEDALKSLSGFDEAADPLRCLSEYIVSRVS